MNNMNNHQTELLNIDELKERMYLLEELIGNEGDEQYADKLIARLRYLRELYDYKLRKTPTI